MEDELGQGRGGGISEPPLRDTLQSETLVENNMGSGNLVDDSSYQEGDDGEEIMVEIVGSDVFVDGVSGNEEGGLGSAEIGDMDGHVSEEKEKESETAYFSEAMDVSIKGGENKKRESELGLPESRNEKNYVFTGENKKGESELGFPESKDENNYVVSEAIDVSIEGGENEKGESELGLSESKDENNYVVNEAMDISSERGENKMRESELGLPESRDEKNLGEESENKKGESELGLPESKDENNYVGNEAMDVSSKGGENKMGESELGLPESRDEKKSGEGVEKLPKSKDENNYVVNEAMDVSSEGDENKMGESELGLPESRDEKKSGEGVENKKGESELGLPESKDENNYVVNEAMDVSSEEGENKIRENELGLPESRDEKKSGEGVENKKGESELGLPESKDENNYVVNEAMDVSSEEGENKIGESGLGLPESRDEKKSGEGGENKMGESELGLPESRDGKNHLSTEAVDVSSEGGENTMGESELELPESKDEKNHVVTEKIDGSFSEHVNVVVGISSVENEEAISTTPMVISEEKTIKDEAVDEKGGGVTEKEEVLPLSGDALNQDRLGSGQIVTSEVTLNPNGEGSENIRVDDETVISEKEEEVLPLSDDASNRDQLVSDSGMSHGAAKYSHDCQIMASGVGIVDEKEDFAAENKDLVVESDSDVENENEGCVNDSHGSKFESNHENEREEACNINDEALKGDGDLETDTDRQDYVVPNKPTRPDDGFDTDVVNKDRSLDVGIQANTKENQPNEPFIAVKVVDGGGLSENIEEIVSQESFECQENAEIPNAVAQVSMLPEITEKTELPIYSNNVSSLDGGEIDQKIKLGEEERESHESMEIDSELENEELSPPEEADQWNEERVKKSASSLKMNQSGYFPPPENEGRFAISDLVWGKVRSHPWWPGQIFDPADASEKAVKYYKKDSYLVAYFGDRTFAWNDSSLLKPFRSHFSLIEKQSNSEGFQNAVDSALEEVSRRVELGLACSCIPKGRYATIETQIVENTGIREEESRKRYGLDHSISTRASYFEPDKLIEYVRDLAPRAFSSGPDRLDLVIARSQLSAFCRFKGYRPPTRFPSPGELLENVNDDEKTSSDEIIIASHKPKHAPNDSPESRKERSLTELMGGDEDEPFGKKRKALDPLTDGYNKRVSIYAAKVSNLTTQTPNNNKPSFKIGECIRRVASQLTGPASSGKDEMVINSSQSMVLSIESFSVDEMLLQLERVGQEPKKRHNFTNVVHTFFMGFRSFVVASNRRGLKKRPERTTSGPGPAEEFEFEFEDDENDSYWTDRIVQNGLGNLQVVSFCAEKKPLRAIRKPHSRKRFSDPTVAGDDELDERVKRRRKQGSSSPAELILNFSERSGIPSEIKLNKMFRRFGPLMESETEVDYESGCAKVIFKRASDAEVACDSSEKFNIFGPVLVIYQIGYEPLISVKVLPLALAVPPPPQEDGILIQMQ